MYVRPKDACKYFNVTDQTLRSWSSSGKITFTTTSGGHRRYLIPNTHQQPQESKEIKIIYSRVSSKKQQSDLDRQTEFLSQRFPEHKSISDIGSGINFNRKGFKRILEGVFKRNIKEVVVANRDRITRFGYSLFEWIFEQHNCKLICIDSNDQDPQYELTEDLLSIITVFSAKYYGKRKYRKKINTDL